jgi:hypothetical protein
MSTYFKNCNSSHRYFWQLAVLPPPVSVSIAFLLFCLSHAARGLKAVSMLFFTHSVCVPELSLSRYLCTSMMRLLVVPSGFLTLFKAAAEPDETKVSALVNPWPGRRIRLFLAPAPRMAVTTA